MQPKILYLNSILGVLGVITCIQALPIELIFADNTCNCAKKSNYEKSMPIENKPSKHDYQLEHPIKAKITYSFDFDIEEPVPKLPLPEPKLKMFAKVNRMKGFKKDYYKTEELPKTCGCGCSKCPARMAQKSWHPNSLDNIEPSTKMPPTTQIMAIFIKPLKQPLWEVSKSRNRRDISRIFTKPRKTAKPSDRIVKQYNKRLKDITPNKRRVFENSAKPIGTQLKTSRATGLGPLQRLSNFFAQLPNLRPKRNIKGEYDLIEKERKQIKLSLPEIMQYMPETLEPNLKKNYCKFGQDCHHTKASTKKIKKPASTKATKASSTKSATAFITENDSIATTEALNTTENSNFKAEEENQTDSNESLMDNTHYTLVCNQDSGCQHAVDNSDIPTPKPVFIYENPPHFLAPPPRSIDTANNPPGVNAIHKYDARSASYHPYYAPDFINNEPILEASHTEANSHQISNAQLDKIISEIIHKHADFMESSVQPNKDFTESPAEQELEAKYFLKSLGSWNNGNWFNANQQQ